MWYSHFDCLSWLADHPVVGHFHLGFCPLRSDLPPVGIFVLLDSAAVHCSLFFLLVVGRCPVRNSYWLGDLPPKSWKLLDFGSHLLVIHLFVSSFPQSPGIVLAIMTKGLLSPSSDLRSLGSTSVRGIGIPLHPCTRHPGTRDIRPYFLVSPKVGLGISSYFWEPADGGLLFGTYLLALVLLSISSC